MEIPAGFVLDDGSTSQRDRENRILKEKFPQLGPESLNNPALRPYLLDQAGGDQALPNSGKLIYRRYKNPDTGEIMHLPEGDSASWLPKASGFKGKFGPLKYIDGQPRIASSLQKRTVYE